MYGRHVQGPVAGRIWSSSADLAKLSGVLEQIDQGPRDVSGRAVVASEGHASAIWTIH
jgi:hypothetical protein